MSDLERALYDAIMVATKACQRLGYNPTYMVRMVHDSGALGACQRLLATAEASEGFSRLWQLNHLALTIEDIVLRPQFAELFTDEQRAVARQRLADVGYFPTGGAESPALP